MTTPLPTPPAKPGTGLWRRPEGLSRCAPIHGSQRSRLRLGGITNFRRRKERSYPCKERGARAVIQHVELQIYLFRRIREDLIRNHVEGRKGFRALLAPWTAAGFARIVGDDEIRFPDPNNR